MVAGVTDEADEAGVRSTTEAGWPPPPQHQDHWFEGAPVDLEKHARPVHTHLASPGALDFWKGRVLAFWDWFVHNKFFWWCLVSRFCSILK